MKLSARWPSDTEESGGSDTGSDPTSKAGSDPSQYSEPIPWVILLKLPAQQSPGVDQNGKPYSSEEKAKYFQEMVDAVKGIRFKGTDREYWARGPNGVGEADIWYFCLITSTQQVRRLEREYGDLFASVRPLTTLYPARKLKVTPPGFIRNRKRAPDVSGKIKPRNSNLTRTINPAYPLHGMLKRELTGQLRAPRELRALGVPPWIWGQEEGWDKLQYNYDQRVGRATEPPVVVYVICKGVDVNHPEFNQINLREMRDWMWADPYPAPPKIYRDYSWGAGTAVFGKIFGGTVGTARQAKPVVVVAADRNGRTSRLHIFDSLLQIHADITKRFMGRKIVISMSWILTFLSDPNNPKSKMDTFDYNLIASIRSLIEMLSKLGVAFVVPGGSIHWEVEDEGNTVVTNPIIGFPAKEGLKRWNAERPFITVGGVDMISWDNYYQSHLNLRVSAPAVDILVPLPYSTFESREVGPAKAVSHTPGDYGTVKGTAYAAGTVAGLFAYFLEMGFDRDEARTIIYAYSYPRFDRKLEHRLDRAPGVVYNGAWGMCKEGTSYYGPLTRELVEVEKDELVGMAQSLVQERWPEDLEWDSDDNISENPKRPTDPALGDLPPGWGEGPGEGVPPVYSPEDSWKRGSTPNKSYWAKCPVQTSSSSSSSMSSSLSSSFATSTTAITVETTSEPTLSSHSVTETEHSTASLSSVRATSTPANNEDDEEESTPTQIEEPEEPAPTLDWVDESLVGEMTWAESELLWAIPAVAAPIIVLLLPLANGGNLTSTITNTNYTSYTVSLKDPSKFDLKKIGISTVPALTTGTKFSPVVPTTSEMPPPTATIGTGPIGPIDPEITPPPQVTVHACKQLFFTTPKPTATVPSSKRWIQTLPVTSWYYVERNLVASVINSDEVCGEGAPELKGKEGGLDKTFYEGSPENFRIAISWTSNPPTKKECKENLHHILDGCHGNNPLNPWNWKGGGTRIIGGTQHFEIQPLDPYRRPPGRKWAACRFWLANGQAYAKIWGYGFLDAFDDINHNLARPKRMGRGPLQFYNKVTLCPGWDGNWWMAPTTPIPHESALWEWVLSIGFKYTYFSNRQGRESKKCVEEAIREAYGMPDFECRNKEWDKGVRYFWDKVTGPAKGP
ncbi:hypothetical protein TWF569_003335 [Orbilia oligospora]|nr:hypothetical protein TWF569_003335 [Orbilia oligospora]